MDSGSEDSGWGGASQASAGSGLAAPRGRRAGGKLIFDPQFLFQYNAVITSLQIQQLMQQQGAFRSGRKSFAQNTHWVPHWGHSDLTLRDAGSWQGEDRVQECSCPAAKRHEPGKVV